MDSEFDPLRFPRDLALVKVSLPPRGDPLGTGLIIWSFHVARFRMRLPYE